MKKITAIQIVILLIAGLVPLLWLREGYIISNGDDFPLFFNPQQAFRTGIYLWSPDFLGYATPTPAYFIYMYSGILLNYLGLSIGSIQIIFQTVLFMIGALSMFYFAKTIYPEHKIAPFIAGFFYMFNIFALTTRHNTGFVWIYAFLPLLLALFTKTVTATYRQDNKTANKNIIYFALTSVLALSFASINPANIALAFFGLLILTIYYLVKFRKQLRPLLTTFGKIAAISIPVNLWWILPILNFYALSPLNLNTTVNVDAWVWTHVRASFLNLFWLNGFWGWTAEFVPNIDSYSNPVFIILVFVPFLLAASALLFKSEKARFNAYLMGALLILVFLAKGLHDPLGQLNLLIYQNMSIMSIFREPASKFTLLMIPFLALLIGFSIDNISRIKFPKIKAHLSKFLVSAVVVLALIVAVQPLIINPLESKTEILPYSSYVKVPDYWFQATDWINNQQGNWKVLLTPLNDFYELPYNWGFYGTDQLVNALIDKPIVSTSSLNGYKINPNTAAALQHLNYSVAYSRQDEFKALIDLLNIRFILQRNDVNTNLPTRSIMSPTQMKSFFAQQPYLHIVEEFGQLDIYEYTEYKPAVYAVSEQMLQQADIGVQTNAVIERTWDFNSSIDVQDWHAADSNQQQGISMVSGEYLRADLLSQNGQIMKIESTLLPAKYASIYSIQTKIAGNLTSEVLLGVEQYSTNMSLVKNSVMRVNNETFGWTYNTFTFEPVAATKYFRVKISYGLQTNITHQSTLWIDYVKLNGKNYTLKTAGLESILNEASQNQNATVLKIQTISPTKISATINTTQPFILATTYELDDFWIAQVGNSQIKPTYLYLGLQGFVINKTGQFEVTIEYTPQTWFYYASAISISAVFVICTVYIYVSKNEVKGISEKSRKALISLGNLNLLNLFDSKLRRELKNCRTFIELGCGAKSPAVNYIRGVYSVGVDGYLPSLKANKKKGFFKDYILADLTNLPIKTKSFDCAAAFDVIEHIAKRQSNILIEKMEEISQRKTIIATPNGFNPKCHLEDGNPLQIHKSGWTAEEFSNKGYVVYGVNGLLKLRGENALATVKPQIFGSLISRLSDPIVYNSPRAAFHLLCVKNKL
jgi:hypothetical protein